MSMVDSIFNAASDFKIMIKHVDFEMKVLELQEPQELHALRSFQ